MIRLVTRNASLAKMVREYIAGDPLTGTFEHERPAWTERPESADFVLTRSSLSLNVERFAASRGAMPLVLPEALDYLTSKARDAHGAGRTLVLIGADYATFRE